MKTVQITLTLPQATALIDALDMCAQIGHHATKNANRCYEIMKVVQKAVAEDRNPNPSFKGVDYDGLTVRYTDDPVPEAAIVEVKK